jgi:hypothetical protein
MVNRKFVGEWKYLNQVLFDISEKRAEKACIELALFLRMIDDDEEISAYNKSTGHPNCGRLIMKNKSQEKMTFRDVANKVIHASRLEWKIRGRSAPLLICHGRDKERWVRADVNIVSLAGVCGQLMS